MFFTLVLNFILFSVSLALRDDGTNCTRVLFQNGPYMNDSLCEIGTVVVDNWLSQTLAFQRKIQLHSGIPLVKATLPGTHNSAISQAYGFGIEQNFLAKFLDQPMYVGDDLGGGVCQRLSVLDQLRLGMRHIEIDINGGYFEIYQDKLQYDLSHIYTCHSPTPEQDLMAAIGLAELQNDIDLQYDPRKLSCIGVHVELRSTLEEIKGWLNSNPNELIILYYDCKSNSVDLPTQVDTIYDTMLSVFGRDMIWAPADGEPLAMPISKFLESGKKVIFEAYNKDMFNHPTKDREILVFSNPLWYYQITQNEIAPYPNCTIRSEPLSSWYGKRFVRTLGSPADWVAEAIKCGVNICSNNYLKPFDASYFIWSWAEGEPSIKDDLHCVVMLANGRWATRKDCDDLPLACHDVHDELVWKIVKSTMCEKGYVAHPPVNGLSNRKLFDAASVEARNDSNEEALVRINVTGHGHSSYFYSHM